jgi:hypothetical protein
MHTATAPQPICTQAQARQLLDDLKAAFLTLPEKKRAILVTELRSSTNLDGTNDRPSAAERQHSFAARVTVGKESGVAGWRFHPEFAAAACETSI